MRRKKMNYFYSKNKQKSIEKLVKHSFFSLFIAYMQQHQNEDVILRDLKKAFSNQKIESFIEDLITEKLLIRNNRRYSLNFSIFDEGEFQEEIKKNVALILQWLLPMKQEERQYVMGEEIWRACFEEEADYFYGTTVDFTSINKQVSGNKTYQFVSLNSQTTLPFSLANYFYLQKKQFPLPPKFLNLAHLIGDVNEMYYFDQVEVIIERIQAKKYKKRRPSIFFDSLILTNTIKSIAPEEGYQLAIPLIDTTKKTKDFPKIKLNRTAAENAYIKRSVYEQLFKELSLSDVSYIRKI